MTKLVALERFYYSGRNVEMGEAFEAEEKDVDLLTHVVKPMAKTEADVPPEGEVPNPSLNSINPNTAVENSGVVTFNATGARFYEGSVIKVGEVFIDTVFVNTGKLTGTLDTAAFPVGGYFTHIENAGSLSESKTFTITAAGAKTTDRTYKRRDMKAEG
jgi:hypothetical protein